MKTPIAVALLGLSVTCVLANGPSGLTLPTLPGNASDHEIKVRLVETGANMGQLSLNCSLSSEKEVKEDQLEMRKSLPRSMGFTTAEYDQIFAQELARFNKVWTALSEAQRKQECSYVHKVN